MPEMEPMTAEDLLALGYADDPYQFEDPSLCAVCTWTSQPTYQE